MAVVVPSLSWACSVALAPIGAATPPQTLARADAGTDSIAPSQVVLSDISVTLVSNACTGAGLSCPELDGLQLTAVASDGVTPAWALRYLAFFGNTEAEVTAATTAELIFDANPATPSVVNAALGVGGARSGSGFGRANLCLALAAVDEAGNVGPRSAASCVKTTDAATATTTKGQCPGGCAVTPGLMAWAAALALVLRRRR